jgi:hypothetical protein
VTALRSNVRVVLARQALPKEAEPVSSSNVDVEPVREMAAEGGTEEHAESVRRWYALSDRSYTSESCGRRGVADAAAFGVSPYGSPGPVVGRVEKVEMDEFGEKRD